MKDYRFWILPAVLWALAAQTQAASWQVESPNHQVRLMEILGAGGGQMTLIADGGDGRTFASESRRLAGEAPLKVSLLPYGGFLAKLTPAT